jgi:hypothetical protein
VYSPLALGDLSLTSRTHKLDLLNNSLSYFREAVSYAQQENADTNQWKFAIVNVAQAMELAFKEYLRRIHPVFIHESIDRSEKTIGIRTALARLTNPAIGNLSITDTEKTKIEKAFDLRNELTHYEFQHEHEHIELKFAEIFSFMIFFYRRHLELETSQFVDEEQHQRIILLVKARAELLARARDYIKNNEIGDVWICPECNEVTFVVTDEQCCFCHRKEKIVDCDCGEPNFKFDLVATDELLEWNYDEGVMTLAEHYDLPNTYCPGCKAEVQQTIESIRRAQYDEDLAMEAYYEERHRNTKP